MSTTWINRGHFYVPHVTPVVVDCSFTVAPADTGGFGITGLKGQGVSQVYMHTSATPAVGNPNPANGIIVVKLADNFSKLYQLGASFHAANSTATTSTVANVINVISTLGTATYAQWLAVGLPAGVIPAIGVAFIATSSAVIGGSAQTAIVTATGAGIDHIEHQGALDLMPVPVGGSPNVGGLLFLSCYKNTVLTAPTTGTIIRLDMYMSQSSVVVAGE